ncbi:hypothetical protein [Mesoaciditoga sp.]
MKRITILILMTLIVITASQLTAQSIEELLNLANEISNLDYADSLSSLSGITSFDLDGEGKSVISSPITFCASTTFKVELSKALLFNTSLSNNGLKISLSFTPSRYEKLSNEILETHMNEKMKLQNKVINLFFDAMKKKRNITQITSEGSSIQNQAEIALNMSAYNYDLEALSALLKTNVKDLKFPKLNVPPIPKDYIPYTTKKFSKSDSSFTVGMNADFSKNTTLGISLGYAWNPSFQENALTSKEELLNAQKEMYFRDIHILASVVKAYDERLAQLFNDYSNTYGKYLNGNATKTEVKKISEEISKLGYQRDLYCIELLREWYLYTYFGE